MLFFSALQGTATLFFFVFFWGLSLGLRKPLSTKPKQTTKFNEYPMPMCAKKTLKKH